MVSGEQSSSDPSAVPCYLQGQCFPRNKQLHQCEVDPSHPFFSLMITVNLESKSSSLSWPPASSAMVIVKEGCIPAQLGDPQLSGQDRRWRLEGCSLLHLFFFFSYRKHFRFWKSSATIARQMFANHWTKCHEASDLLSSPQFPQL